MAELFKIFRLGIVNLIGITMPGIVFIIILILGFFPPALTFLIEFEQNVIGSESNISWQSIYSSYLDNKILIVFTILILSYLLGYILRLWPIDELDKKSAIKVLRKVISDMKRGDLTKILSSLRGDLLNILDIQRNQSDKVKKLTEEVLSNHEIEKVLNDFIKSKKKPHKKIVVIEKFLNNIKKEISINEKDKNLKYRIEEFLNINNIYRKAAEIDHWPYRLKENETFPYLYLKDYLESRNLENLAKLIPWDPREKDVDTGSQRTKKLLDILKIEIRIKSPELSAIVESNEAHLRLLFGTWRVTKITLFWIITGLTICIIGSGLAYFYSSSFSRYIVSLFINIILLITVLWVTKEIENKFHYQRVRELIYILGCADSVRNRPIDRD